ncbi:serine/threonine-protein kinase [Nocardia sp. NPDC052566]|uniref:serine/threonine-protein kinase n=1 Tax=Nocardia sp. NPDC052566 TaxID=3364330 RepID=UPI0037CABCD0
MNSGRTTVDGRFELIEPLGSGGMGTVWRAYDTALQREVALKEVRAAEQDGGSSPEIQRERVLREARALARIGHPNVVAIHHIVDTSDETHPWIVMELVRGRTLSDYLAAGPIAPAQAARLGLGILAALRAAHAVGILHRDVKPANVLLREDGSPVLTDFGIAAISGANSLTSTGSVVGSLEYVAPERLTGQEGHSASDLWSLGLVLFVAVEGYQPMRRDTSVATLAAVLRGEVPPPRHAGPLTPTLQALLIPDPNRRPTADHLQWMLTQAANAPGQFGAPAPSGGSGLDISGGGGAPSFDGTTAAGGVAAGTPEGGSAFGANAGPGVRGGVAFVAPSISSGSGPDAHGGGGAFSGNVGPGAHSGVGAPDLSGGSFAPGGFGGPGGLGDMDRPGATGVAAGGSGKRRVRRRSRGMVVEIAAIAVVIAVVVGVVVWRSSGNQATDPGAAGRPSGAQTVPGTAGRPPGTPAPAAPTGDLLTPDGFRKAIAALEKVSGGQEFTEATFYSTYVNAGAPVKGQPKIYDEFVFRNGVGSRKGPGGQVTGAKTVQLSSINWDILPDLFRKADELLNIPKPTLRYVIVNPAWPFNSDKPTLLVYLTDEYGGAYLAADTDGSVVRTYPRER